MIKSAFERNEKVTPITLYYSASDLQLRSRSSAFAALARLAVSSGNWKEAEPLYKLAIDNAEESWGAESRQVSYLLGELAGVYFHLGERALSQFYKRRAGAPV